MAIVQNIVNTILPSFAFDYVAVLTQDYKQVFKDARPLKAIVKEEAKLMEHPVETGITIVDHRIILPIEIEISLILPSADYKNTYNQIRELYLNATLLIVQTRSGVYLNQLIQSMPHEEDPSMYDVFSIALSCKQVQFVTASFSNTPAKSSNTNTADRGTQQSKTVSRPTAAQQIRNKLLGR